MWKESMTQDERRWCQVAMTYGGSFLRAFAHACMRADEENEIILAPALKALIEKYPKYADDRLSPKEKDSPGSGKHGQPFGPDWVAQKIEENERGFGRKS